MQLLAILALVAVLSAIILKKDEIRPSKKRRHISYIVNKKTVKKDSKTETELTGILLSSKTHDSNKANIPLKKNPDPKKARLKRKLDRKLRKKQITQAQYDKICEKERLNSYFVKQIRKNPESDYGENFVETKGWSLDPADRKLAYDMYHTHLKNKEELERARARKDAEKSKKNDVL